MNISNRNDFLNLDISSRFSYSEDKMNALQFEKLKRYPDKAYIESLKLTDTQSLILKLIHRQKVISMYQLERLSSLKKAVLKKNLKKLVNHSLIQNRSDNTNSIFTIDYNGSYFLQKMWKVNSKPSFINDSKNVLSILSFNQLIINIFKNKVSSIKKIKIHKGLKKLPTNGEIVIKVKNIDTPFIFFVLRRNINTEEYFEEIKNDLVSFSKTSWKDHYEARPVIVFIGEDDSHNIEISKTLRAMYAVDTIEKSLNIKYTNDLVIDMLPLNYIFNNFDEQWNIKPINATFFQ